jgi:hypothetical protein
MLDRTTVRRPSAAIRGALAGLLASILLAGFAAAPTPADAAGPKVVIVVGPSGSATTGYLAHADAIAVQARAYGATVVKVYTPRATWAKVSAAAQGAKVLIYLGHGNGWPSPYGRFQTLTKDGMGLNTTYGGSRTGAVKYWGERYIRNQIRLAPGAVVMLNHLCYASGNGEPGARQPGWTTARKRVDNFAYGFIGAGARAVIAAGHSDLSRELGWVLGPGTRDLVAAWRADWESNGNVRSFTSPRRWAAGYVNYLDPDRTSAGFYRSLTTRPGFTVGSGGIIPTPTPTPTPTPAPTSTPED